MAIAMMMAIATTAMQVIRSDVVAKFEGPDVGVGVVAADSLAQKAVTADDPQYDCVPAKLAVTV